MVMLKYASGAPHRSGKFGGVFFRQMKCSDQIALPPGPPKLGVTPGQLIVKLAFYRAWQYWLHYLTDNQRYSWWVYSFNHEKTDRKGGKYRWTGPNWFMHFNLPRILNGLDPIFNPPLD